MFCQAVKREEQHNIEYMNKSKQMMEDTRFDPVIRVRLSGISDLPAAEGNYHLSCLVNFERKVEKKQEWRFAISRFGHARTLQHS